MINSYDKITDRLYVGDIMSPRMILQRKEQISHILSLITLDKTLKKILNKKGIVLIEHEFGDNVDEDIVNHFETLLPQLSEIMNNENSKLLIHCMVGRSRSVGILILIMMHFFKYNFEDAYKLVSLERDIGMNPKFFEDVKNYQPYKEKKEQKEEKVIKKRKRKEKKKRVN